MRQWEQHQMLALVPDYALGLLGDEDEQKLEQHAAQCSVCREAIEREQWIMLSVRSTLAAATKPNPVRLAALRPERRRSRLQRGSLALHRLAPVAVLVLLILSTIAVQFGPGNESDPRRLPAFLPATYTPTATATLSPTATLGALQPTEPVATIVAEPVDTASLPLPALAPLPTPIAALPPAGPMTN